ncbi:hypothetical protein HanIR_Chr16g0844411 [Helianthus annuus]|nr:hypothetical protein HanIR_Chr16g0844411 [Helianthus annuus]
MQISFSYKTKPITPIVQIIRHYCKLLTVKSCPLCGMGVEPIDHLFTGCLTAVILCSVIL